MLLCLAPVSSLGSMSHFSTHVALDFTHRMASYDPFAAISRLMCALWSTPIVCGVVSPPSLALNVLPVASLSGLCHQDFLTLLAGVASRVVESWIPCQSGTVIQEMCADRPN